MGKRFYHKGTINIKVEEGTQPEGFELGMYLSPESRAKLSNRMLGDKNPMKNPDIAKKVGDSQRGEKSYKWGTKNSIEANLKNSESHKGDKNPMKRKEVSEKVRQKLVGKTPWNKGKTIKTDPRVALSPKVLESRKQFFENVDSNYFAPIVKKRHDTMKENGSMCSSKEEDKAYELLLSKFKQEDIDRQHMDSKYPYRCDFYISSIDTYIECNFYFTHGGHPFGTVKSDEDTLNLLKQKAESHKNNQNQYKVHINVWTKSDVEKFNCAKEHNLNYKAFYTFDELSSWVATL